MAENDANDDWIGEALLIGVVRQEVFNVAQERRLSAPVLPEAQPISNAQDKELVLQLTHAIKVIGDGLNREVELNDMIDGLAKVADRDVFMKLVHQVFTDDQINWGRIIVLFYSIGKLSAKMVMASLPTMVTEILTSSLEYFRGTLSGWIRKMGGWISSISALTRFTIERFPAPPLSDNHALFLGAVVSFIGGILLGGLVVLNFHKT